MIGAFPAPDPAPVLGLPVLGVPVLGLPVLGLLVIGLLVPVLALVRSRAGAGAGAGAAEGLFFSLSNASNTFFCI